METIMLDNTELAYERKQISVDDLTLDPSDPRTQNLIGHARGDVTQEQLDEMLWEKDAVKALAMAIEQNGGVYEDLIVQRLDGRYVVRDGNCRAVATGHVADKHEGVFVNPIVDQRDSSKVDHL